MGGTIMSSHTNLRTWPEIHDIARHAAIRASAREGVRISITLWVARAIRDQAERERAAAEQPINSCVIQYGPW
jgi:hypothetical protein